MRLVLLAVALLATAPLAAAQSSADTAAVAPPPVVLRAPDGTPCTVEACTLGLDRRGLGDHLVQGTPGQRVGRTGIASVDLARVVAPVAQARLHARQAYSARTVAMGLTLAAGLTFWSGLFTPDEAAFNGRLFGAAGLLAGGALIDRWAVREQGRAVQAYNAALPR